MADLNYRKCAEEIFSYLGGKENIISAAHCATRLRLVVADNSKIDTKALEDVEGVKGLVSSNGQLQLIIGTGTVNKVYEEFLAVTGVSAASKDDVKKAAASKMPLWKKILKTPGDVCRFLTRQSNSDNLIQCSVPPDKTLKDLNVTNATCINLL